MRCAKAREYLSHQLDEQLTPDRARDLDRHLDGCEDCRDYREDLALGSRLLAATEPELPENFDWKLQLKLNQALQQAAGETAYPWAEKPSDPWRWFGNFGAAAAVGLAAVLAVAVFFGPVERPGGGGPTGETRLAGEAPAQTVTDRLPLRLGTDPRSGALPSQGLVRNVSRGPSYSGGDLFQPSWSVGDSREAQTIILQQKEIRMLQARIRAYQNENLRLRRALDTLQVRALDTGQTD